MMMLQLNKQKNVIIFTIMTIMIIINSIGYVICIDDSLRDIQVGMQGLAEAAKDPAVLAQLMKDMQVRTNTPVFFF